MGFAKKPESWIVQSQTHYMQTEEEAEALTQNYNNEAVEKKQYCRKIKKQLINFVKIELGKQTEILILF